MNQMNGEYFGDVINRLKEVKASEKIMPNDLFKQNLKTQLIQHARTLEHEPFDFAQFFRRWKYAFGLVPTFAVVALVAANFSSIQFLFKSQQILPSENKVVNTSGALIGSNSNIEQSQDDQTPISSVFSNQSEDLSQPAIKTFPGYLVLPPSYLPLYLEKNGDGSILNFDDSSFQIDQSSVVVPLKQNVIIVYKNDADKLPKKSSSITVPKINLNPIPTSQSGTTENTAKTQPSTFVETPKIAAPLVVSPVTTSTQKNSDQTVNTDSTTQSKITDTSKLFSAVLSPQKVYFGKAFTTEEQTYIFRAIYLALGSKRSTSLRTDYYIQVELLTDGKVKTTLFEDKKATVILFFEKKDKAYSPVISMDQKQG